jgi:hypothetical protein
MNGTTKRFAIAALMTRLTRRRIAFDERRRTKLERPHQRQHVRRVACRDVDRRRQSLRLDCTIACVSYQTAEAPNSPS